MKFATDLSKGILGGPDSAELWSDIIAEIPDSVLLTPGVRILNVACGHGTEAALLSKRMLALGVSKQDVNNSIWLIDKYRVFTNPAKQLFGFKNVITEDFLRWDPKMKFDVVLGNPPYQSSGTQGKKLWKEFFVKFSTLMDKDGFMAILTPSSYVKRTGQKMGKVREIVEKNTVHYLDIDATKYFNVGEDICGLVLQEGKRSTQSKVKFGNKIELQDLNTEFNPVFGQEDVLIKGILSKVQNFPLPKLPIKEDINNSQAKWVEDGRLSKTQDSVYQYPVVYTPNTTHYSKTLFGDQNKLKLMLTIAGTYYSEKLPDRNIYVTTDHSGQGMCHILIASATEGKNIKSYLISKLYRFYIETEKTSGYNTGIKHLPELDRTRSWTDADVYKLFNLTQEEINFVEQAIK